MNSKRLCVLLPAILFATTVGCSSLKNAAGVHVPSVSTTEGGSNVKPAPASGESTTTAKPAEPVASETTKPAEGPKVEAKPAEPAKTEATKPAEPAKKPSAELPPAGMKDPALEGKFKVLVNAKWARDATDDAIFARITSKAWELEKEPITLFVTSRFIDAAVVTKLRKDGTCNLHTVRFQEPSKDKAGKAFGEPAFFSNDFVGKIDCDKAK